ncbi:arylsulfatase [Flexibacterium corallicola]|uniref:arylsulfatase n=1 Tax=Flexibacterium corallicola TaxID=3037259 RepID=UPI00286F1666|nr:arylsulfatase [Pseudovibrio sp. M1P-2-3]
MIVRPFPLGFKLCLFIAASITLIFSSSAQQKTADKPNILVIMADDVSWDNVGVYSQDLKSIETPNLDRLASEGMRFTDYYAQPTCTAGRSAFITGQLPIRTGLHTVGLPGDPIGLSAEDPSLAQLLKKLGYATGQFGKNHLGDRNEFLPTVHGFDEYWGWLYHLNAMEYESDPDWPDEPKFNDEFAPRHLIHSWAQEDDDPTIDPRWGKVGKQKIQDEGPAPPERQKTLDDDVTRYTIDFMERSVKEQKPFFVWMAPARAHVWTYLKKEYEDQLGNGLGLQDVIMKELDDNVGKALEALDRLGISQNTIVIFTSDNGPETLTWPDGGTTLFHGEKGTTWEGGFRVPAIIRWPDNVPAGHVEKQIFDAMDWMPTLVAAAGGPQDLPAKLKEGMDGYKVHLDGYNQLDLLKGTGPSKRKEVILYERTELQAIRYGDWKAHFVIQPEGWFGPKVKLNAPILYNLRRDPYEKVAVESGMYIKWLGKKMWAFGPVQRLVQYHLETLEEFPPREPKSGANSGKNKAQQLLENVFSQ